MSKNQPFEGATPPAACTPACCTDDEEEDRLQCRLCKRTVHYECTQLPLYQLQIFVTTYNDQYTCPNCVRITRTLTNKVGKNTYHMMQRELEKKDGVIEKLKNELNKKTRAHRTIKTELETFLSEKIKEIKEETKVIIKEEISKTTDIMTKRSDKTYAEITKIHKEEIKRANDQHMSDKKEERDIASRKRNIIIHGLQEDKNETKEEKQKEDRSAIEDLLGDIGFTDIPSLTHHRIGTYKDKHRPIKVTFQNESDKNWTMKNLCNLKKLSAYINISITEDFTISERNEIKKLHDDAKIRNAEDSDNTREWVVRGSPRTLLRIINIPKKIFRL